MAIILANNATAKLAGAVIPESSILVLQAGHGEAFPSPSSPDWFPVTLVDSAGSIEICKCTSRSGDVLTVSRAQEGTSAKAFAVSSRVSLRITKAVLDYISSVTNPLGALSPSPDKIAYYTGPQTASLATLTAFARSIIDDTDASAVLTTLGVSSFVKTLLGMTTGASIANQIGAINTTDVGFTKAASGYVAIPLSDGSKIYIQWGKTGSLVVNGNAAVTFPTAFPTGCYAVVTGNPTGGPTNSSVLTTSAPTASGFTMYGDGETTTPNGGYWIAIGY